MKTSYKLLIIGMVTLLCACSTSTMTTSSWRKNNATANNYRHIFIAALTKNIPVRQAVEDGLQGQFQQKGITVSKSIEVLPPDFSNQTGAKRELILSKIQSTGADGILTIALLRQETESRYVAGGGRLWNPGLRYGYYGRFWNYYSNWSPYVYAQDYYDERQVYYLETNLYNARTEDLIWAAQSKTYDPSNVESFLKDYVKAIEAQMIKDGVITGNAAK